MKNEILAKCSELKNDSKYPDYLDLCKLELEELKKHYEILQNIFFNFHKTNYNFMDSYTGIEKSITGMELFIEFLEEEIREENN